MGKQAAGQGSMSCLGQHELTGAAADGSGGTQPQQQAGALGVAARRQHLPTCASPDGLCRSTRVRGAYGVARCPRLSHTTALPSCTSAATRVWPPGIADTAATQPRLAATSCSAPVARLAAEAAAGDSRPLLVPSSSAAPAARLCRQARRRLPSNSCSAAAGVAAAAGRLSGWVAAAAAAGASRCRRGRCFHAGPAGTFSACCVLRECRAPLCAAAVVAMVGGFAACRIRAGFVLSGSGIADQRSSDEQWRDPCCQA